MQVRAKRRKAKLKMKILLYNGGEKIMHKSGVGRAMDQQKKALSDAGVAYTQDSTDSYDVVDLNTILPDSLFQGVKAKITGRKVVYHGHSTEEDFKNSFIGTNLMAPFFKQWLRVCYGTADAVVAPTPYAQKLLEGYGINTPIYSISNGVDTAYYTHSNEDRKAFRKKYGIRDNEKVVLSVGLCIERKGIFDFVALAEMLPQHQFYWFGEAGPLVPAQVHSLIKNAPGNCHFPGYIEREEIKQAYSGADVFLFLTHEETEGMVLLEALSMEIPVLVRDIPIYEDWLRKDVDVYKAKELPEFYEALKGMLEGEKPRLTASGRLVAEERSILNTGKKLKVVYESVIKPS